MVGIQTRLGNQEVRRVVEQAVQELVTEYLECHPEVLESILAKAIQAFKVLFNIPLGVSLLCFDASTCE